MLVLVVIPENVDIPATVKPCLALKFPKLSIKIKPNKQDKLDIKKAIKENS